MVDLHSSGIKLAKYIVNHFATIANCTITFEYNADKDEICIVFTWTGAGGGSIYLMYELPEGFLQFAGKFDDLFFEAKQTGDSGDGADVEIAIEVYDDGGRNISDASLTAAVTSVAAWVERDCALNDPDEDAILEGGDRILVKITISGTVENNDILIMTIPKIKCTSL